MAIDYTFVGIALTFVMGMTFMLLALFSELPQKIMYHLFSAITFFLCAQLFLMAYTSTYVSVVPVHYTFYLFSIINFALFVLGGVETFRLLVESHKRKKFGLEDEY